MNISHTTLRRWLIVGAISLIGLMLPASHARAQAPDTPNRPDIVLRVVDDAAGRPLANLDYRAIAAAQVSQPPRRGDQVPARSTVERSVGWKILGAAIGGVGGFFAGGFLGAALEPDCNCDDPGFKGFLIGMPIGTAVGAIVGWKVM